MTLDWYMYFLMRRSMLTWYNADDQYSTTLDSYVLVSPTSQSASNTKVDYVAQL